MINKAVIFNVLGKLLCLLGVAMVVPLLVAFYYDEPLRPFVLSVMITGASGILLSSVYKVEGEWKTKEAFAIVAFGWLAAAVFGSLPFILEGVSPVNALFESISGFTTTGATILQDIEGHTMSFLFWRCMTQWLGGMGIIMIFIAILPKLGVAGRQLFRAEVPGPTEDKLKPRIRSTARILWTIYIVVSVAMAVALKLAGMTWYYSITHTFATISTGGFSPYGMGVAQINDPLIEAIIVIFMFIGGANFSLYYRVLHDDHKCFIKDEEFRYYTLIVLLATAILTFTLWKDMGQTVASAFRYAIFNVVSLLTTTGFASTDFDLWTDSSRIVLLAVLFIGGCAGSTSGGIKVVRVLLMGRYGKNVLLKTLHPRAIKPIKYNDKAVPDDIMQSIISFVFIYLMVFATTTGALSLMGMDILSSISASITTLGNSGPGFNMVGPMDNFDVVPILGKLLLIWNMWVGRLELFTVLALLTREFWKD